MSGTKDWKELEIIVEGLQKQVAPDAVVRRNHRVKGQSGRKRQLDVTLTQNIGLHKVFIVLECKRYKRRVGIDRIEAFATKLRDVGASLGVLVSSSGFDDGAREQAERNNIQLMTYRAAEDADWQKLTNSENWVRFLVKNVSIDKLELSPYIDDLEGSLDMRLYNATKTLSLTLGEQLQLMNEMLNAAISSIEDMGWFEIEFQPKELQFVEVKDKLHNIDFFRISGTLTAQVYTINVHFGGGHVINDAVNPETNVTQVYTSTLNIPELLESTPYVELTPEEYREQKSQMRDVPAKLPPFLSIVLTKSNTPP